jgi:hypothetical protein
LVGPFAFCGLSTVLAWILADEGPFQKPARKAGFCVSARSDGQPNPLSSLEEPMPTATLAAAGARNHVPPHPANRPVIVGEFQLNNFEVFRAELIERNGKRIISIARWKSTPGGERRVWPEPGVC